MGAIDDMQATMAEERLQEKRHAAAAHKQLWGDITGNESAEDAEDKEMKVMAGGNVTVNHHYPPKEVTPPEKPVETPVVPAAASGLSTLAKLGIGAGLLATGAGAGLGIPMILSGASDVVKPPAVVAPAETKPTDSPIAFGIKVGKP